jgi:hypothetical protein
MTINKEKTLLNLTLYSNRGLVHNFETNEAYLVEYTESGTYKELANISVETFDSIRIEQPDRCDVL